MRKVPPQSLSFLLSFLSPRNVTRYAANQNWPSGTVELEVGERADPAHLAARQYDSIFSFIIAAAPQPLSSAFQTERIAIVGVDLAGRTSPNSSRSAFAKPNNPRHLSLAQISFRARSESKYRNRLPQPPALIRSSLSRKLGFTLPQFAGKLCARIISLLNSKPITATTPIKDRLAKRHPDNSPEDQQD